MVVGAPAGCSESDGAGELCSGTIGMASAGCSEPDGACGLAASTASIPLHLLIAATCAGDRNTCRGPDVAMLSERAGPEGEVGYPPAGSESRLNPGQGVRSDPQLPGRALLSTQARKTRARTRRETGATRVCSCRITTRMLTAGAWGAGAAGGAEGAAAPCVACAETPGTGSPTRPAGLSAAGMRYTAKPVTITSLCTSFHGPDGS